MSDETPAGDKAVYVFIEMIALEFILFSIEEAFKDQPSWTNVAIASTLGLLFFLLGVTWTRLKGRLQSGFVRTIEHISNDYRYRYGLGLFLIGVVGAYTIVSLRSLRNDLDTYVIPRTLTDKQKIAIRSVLIGHAPPDTVNIVFNSFDQEATIYTGQIAQTLQDSGWNIHLWPINPFDPNAGSKIRTGSFNASSLLATTGVDIATEGGGDHRDDAHPTPDVFLDTALNKAQIDHSNGSAANRDKYSLTVAVGRRPYTLVPHEPSVLFRIGHWIEGLGDWR
jgi:hypothetical protein